MILFWKEIANFADNFKIIFNLKYCKYEKFEKGMLAAILICGTMTIMTACKGGAKQAEGVINQINCSF